MDAVIKDLTKVGSTCLRYTIGIEPCLIQEYAYLLDSMDNLAVHSSTGKPNEIMVTVPEDLKIEFETYTSLFFSSYEL